MPKVISSLEIDEPSDREKSLGCLRGCLATRPPDAINFLLGGWVLLSEEGEALGQFRIEDLMEASGKA